MNESEMIQNGEINLFELWEKLRAGWYYVVGGTFLGVAAAGVLLMVLPPKYEAVAIVQVGRVGRVGENTPFTVEQPAHSVERMRTPSFQIAVAESVGNQAWIDDLARSSSATAKHLKLELVKSSVVGGAAPLIEVKARGDSPGSARKIAEVVVIELANRQTEIAKPIIDKMRLDLAISKEKLASAEKELDGLNKMMANVVVKDDRFTQLSLITSLRVQKEAEVFGQRQTIMAYETALMPPATQPAQAVEAVFVTDTPVSPKKTLVLALGLIGGLLAGVVAAFFVDAWRWAKRERRTAAS